ASRQAGYQGAGYSGQPGSVGGGGQGYSGGAGPPATPEIGGNLVADGLEQIRQSDRHFDANHFLEVASDVFFQIQAGWMRRDLDSYRHLLGSELAAQYAEHFAEMRRLGQINKLESIAIRNVEIVAAGSDGQEDFVTVQFTANLLDYTVDDQSGEVLDGSVSTPVKFQEQWTWARPVGTEEWKLEGIKEG
ncbi:MAG: Tim44 domain-containing protein, partial [Desulforhopalus sp.]|nr:Tim44 domain-containing protein [Desulforhopalus sp.]